MNGKANKNLKNLICAGLVILALVIPAKATLVNSNSMVDLGIEYYIQTDKAVYDLGENVEMLFRVTNLRDEEVSITCSQLPEYNLWVQRDEESIWERSLGGYPTVPEVELLPGEYEELGHSWDMKDNDGVLVEPGLYTVVGLMYNSIWNYDNYGDPFKSEVGVQITIIPEPGSLGFFVGVLSFLGYYNRKRKS
jgi:hypothetical protein